MNSKMINNQAGFSLMEILVALTILGIVGGFAASKFFEAQREGEIKAVKIQMNSLGDRLKEFRRKCGFFPTTDQGLESLVTKPGGKECKDYPPTGFIDGDKVPKDSWGEDFLYESDSNTFNICTNGPDRVQGGEGDNADICLYDNKPKPQGSAPEAQPQQ